MNLGFKVQLPPQTPRVLAAPGQMRCGERYEAQGGVRCERPYGHAGGHLSTSPARYWQSGEAS